MAGMWQKTDDDDPFLIDNYFIYFVTIFFIRSVAESSEMDVVVSTGGSKAITAIVSFSKGFACASGSTGIVHVFEKADERDFYRKQREITVCMNLLFATWAKHNKHYKLYYTNGTKGR